MRGSSGLRDRSSWVSGSETDKTNQWKESLEVVYRLKYGGKLSNITIIALPAGHPDVAGANHRSRATCQAPARSPKVPSVRSRSGHVRSRAPAPIRHLAMSGPCGGFNPRTMHHSRSQRIAHGRRHDRGKAK